MTGLLKNNGNGDTLPEHRQKQVEAGLAQYQAVAAERDELQHRLKEATTTIEGYQVQLNALQGVINLMESTMTTYRITRDEAVIRAATLLEALDHIHLVIQKHWEAHPAPQTAVETDHAV